MFWYSLVGLNLSTNQGTSMNTDTQTTRRISLIAAEISRDWKKPYFGAVPYLTAMASLDSITDFYFQDDARSIITYFLTNATTWKGETARRIKAELKALSA